ncbi:unnamed protein product, partial [Trichogramma brassicae]
SKGKSRDGTIDDGDYATLRELPLASGHDEDNTSEENKLERDTNKYFTCQKPKTKKYENQLLECVNDDHVTYYASGNRDLQPSSEGENSPLDALPDPPAPHQVEAMVALDHHQPLPLPPPTPTKDTQVLHANSQPSGLTPRCLRRADSGMPADGPLTPRSDSSHSPPLDPTTASSNAISAASSNNSETSSSGIHSSASSQRRATSVEDLTNEPREEPHWRSCSLQRGTQPPTSSNSSSPAKMSNPGRVIANPNATYATNATAAYVNHQPIYNGETTLVAGVASPPPVILETEATVVIRRKNSRPKIQEPGGLNEEPFGRSTNMRMTSFTEATDLRAVQSSSATLPHYPTQPTVTYPHCSTMPLPHASHGYVATNGMSGSCGSVQPRNSPQSALQPITQQIGQATVTAPLQVVTNGVTAHTLPSHHNGVRLMLHGGPNPFVKRFPPVQTNGQQPLGRGATEHPPLGWTRGSSHLPPVTGHCYGSGSQDRRRPAAAAAAAAAASTDQWQRTAADVQRTSAAAPAAAAASATASTAETVGSTLLSGNRAKCIVTYTFQALYTLPDIMTSSRTIIGAVALTCALVPICWLEIRAENLTYTSVIETAGGRLRGAVFRTIRKHKVYSSFKGIPFAEPPLGYLRFKPPVEKKRWSGVLDALVQGSVCTQYDLFNLTLIGAEDCLYLNVFTPHSDFSNATELKAVMVWIFGGGYLTGYPNTEFTGPDFLLEKDVILVAMNYRLGALGFLNLDHENATGNAGLKDQTLALRWVQKNIREFRGDPERVTIFGVSAGSSSVDFHILSPMSAGLFSRSIAMSGSAMNTWWPLQSRLESRMQEFAMGFLFGFPSFSKESLLQSLYEADARSIVRRSTLVLVSKIVPHSGHHQLHLILSTQSRSRCSHEDETWLLILSVRLAASSFPLRWLGLLTMIVHLRVSYSKGWMGSCLSGLVIWLHFLSDESKNISPRVQLRKQVNLRIFKTPNKYFSSLSFIQVNVHFQKKIFLVKSPNLARFNSFVIFQSIENVDARVDKFCRYIEFSMEETYLRQQIMLLNYKSLFPSCNDRLNMLKFALKNHGFKILRLLRANNFNFHEVVFENGKSALHYLVELDSSSERNIMSDGGTMELIQFFVKDSPKNYIDEHGFSYFHGACVAGDVETIRRFLSEGVDVELIDTWRCSPLHVAAQYRRKEVVQLLLENGAEASGEDHSKSTPLHALARMRLCECSNRIGFCDFRRPVDEIVDMLIENGANIEALNAFGDSPLMSAVRSFDVDLTRSLLKRGASLNGLNEERMFSYDFTQIELKNYPLTLNIVEVMKLLQSAGYRLDFDTRLRMLKCWLRARGNDTDNLIPIESSDKDADGQSTYDTIVDNICIHENFGFYQTQEAADYLQEQRKQSRSKLPELTPEHRPWSGQAEGWEQQIAELESIKLNNDISLYKICQMSYDEGYSILKKMKNWSLPPLLGLQHEPMNLVVKRHLANILMRLHLELLVADLFTYDYCQGRLPYVVCRMLAEKMDHEDLLRLCEQTDENVEL